MTWTAQDSKACYSVDRWSDGLFDIDDQGRLLAFPRGPDGPAVVLGEAVSEAEAMGLPLPLLIRFTDILAHRVGVLREAFAQAIEAEGYGGAYQAIYPIKVNQRESVVRRIVESGPAVGLEAGSKPELLAVLAMSASGGTVICNGYKDADYIRMALMGNRLGLRVYLVVEKLAELPAILRISEELDIPPVLGVRVRLASIGFGKWQNTGGDKAKFGLSATQLLEAVRLLESAGRLDSLQLLHFHMGSQISNLRDIHLGVSEAARYYEELWRLGCQVRVLDVGGGLAVDYEGAGSRGYFSMNYGAGQYARAIVRAVGEACDEAGLPHPELFSESGRALTAHHAVLVTEVSAAESIGELQGAAGGDPSPPPVIAGLETLLTRLEERTPAELFEEARYLFNEGKDRFVQGQLSLTQRARLETLFFALCQAVRRRLHASRRADQALKDELRPLLADKYFCNFSIFRSLPDIWAIDQVFPIVPLDRLAERPDQRAILEDLTCDSDGRIDHYVEADGIESTLPVHAYDPDRRYRLAVFLVGAYQEILGDDHNLFGRTHSVDLSLTGDGWRLHDPVRGDAAAAVLREVGFERDSLLAALGQRIRTAPGLAAHQRQAFQGAVSHSLDAYTYLTTDDVERD